MKSFTKVVIPMLLVGALGLPALAADPVVPDPGSEDCKAIVQACKDYVEGFLTGNQERLENGLHPRLVKRNRASKSDLAQMTRDDLVKYSAGNKGKTVNPDYVRVQVYDITNNIAMAAIWSDYVDYCQLAKLSDRWQVVNVLWTMNTPKK